jgi:GNAT superfamily N-acetyltransferase
MTMREDPGPANSSRAVDYRLEPELTIDEFVAVLEASTLAERRPVDDRARIARMLRHANLIVTARTDDGRLVGVSRALADFGFCCYLSDLAVDRAWQRRGIGRALIERTWDAAGRETTLILLAAPKAVDYYPHIGMRRHEHCYVYDRQL